MPKLLAVNPTGFFSYGIHATLPLDQQGLVLLDGKNHDSGGTANGAGKTSLLNAIVQILFGKNPSGITGEGVVNQFLGKAFGRVMFLDDKGAKWRVTDVKKWRKSDKYPDQKLNPDAPEDSSELHGLNIRYSGTDVFLERWDPQTGMWMDERSSNKNAGDVRLDLKATRKKIVQIFGMSYEQFMSIGYLAQQQSLKFLQGTHKEKLEVLSDLCNLAAWDERVAAVRERLSDAEAEQSRQEATLFGLRRAGSTLTAPDPNQKILWETMSADCAQKIQECDNQMIALQKERQSWMVTTKQVELNRQSTVSQLQDITVLREQTRRKIDKLVLEYTNKCNLIRNRPIRTEANQLETEISEIKGQIQARRFDMEQLLTGAGKCPRCRSNVTMEHLVRQRELLLLEIKALDEKVLNGSRKLQEYMEEWQQGITTELNQAETWLKESKTKIEAELLDIDAQTRILTDALEQLKRERADLGEDPQSRLDALSTRRLLFASEKARHDDRIAAWSDAAQKHAAHQDLISQAEARALQTAEQARYLAALDTMFGDKGIKAYKLNTLLAQLNYALKEYIDIITENSVSLAVTQYREKTDGSMTADIQILVQESHKRDVPLELYSGGERQQIMLAFIGAFWQVAAQYGAGINTLFLDEILGPMDDINAQRAFDFIEHMRSKGKSTIVVTTHNPNVKQQIRFDQIWTAVKRDHVTTIRFEG